MSLLDDVSIVVTPNGYKAGELYAVIPVPTEGAEEITNGDFATDSGWIKEAGWTISGGTANCTSASGKSLYQTNTLIAGRQYKLNFTVSNYSTGYLGSLGNDFGGVMAEANGTYEIIGTATGTSFGIVAQGSFTGSIDNLSVKEYTSADMDVTRATAATRVDENGLVNYAEVIGGELAICGDFECASPLTDWTVNSDGAISIDSGKLKVLNVTNRGRAYRTYTGLTIGKTYEVFVGNTSGNVTGFSHITSGTSFNNITLNAPFFFVAGATTAAFECGVNSTIIDRFTFFDDISLKENARDNVPRIDYTGGGCPHILAEPQRTNLILNSEPITNEGAAANITYESFSWAIGFNNCVEFGDNSVARYWYGSSVTSGTEYTLSAYILMDDNSEPVVSNDISSGDFSLNIGNAIGGGTINASVSMGNNIWRVSKTKVSTQTTSNNGVLKYTTQSSKGFKVVGLQMEVGSYPTSYIPTSGSTVTRNQDIFSRDGIGSLINSTEGVLFLEIAAFVNDSSSRYIGLTDGNSNNRVVILYYSNNDRIRVLLSSGGTKYFDEYYTVTSLVDFHKVAVKWKANEFALWIDGFERATETAYSFVPIGLNTLALDQAGSNNFFGKVKQLQVYDTALTDDTIALLTS